MDLKSLDPATRERARRVRTLLFSAKANESIPERGRAEKAGRLRDEAEELTQGLRPDVADWAWEFYRTPGNLSR